MEVIPFFDSYYGMVQQMLKRIPQFGKEVGIAPRRTMHLLSILIMLDCDKIESSEMAKGEDALSV
jgi:hypothetical protein